MDNVLNVPGDYKAERLLQKLTNAWPPRVGIFDRDGCTFGTDPSTGRSVTHKDLQEKGTLEPLTTFLDHWAGSMARSGRTILGWPLKRDEVEWSDTYRPTSIQHMCNLSKLTNSVIGLYIPFR